MPNWCEGTLKVRGTLNDLKNFVLNGLKPVDLLGNEQPQLQLENVDDTYLFINVNDSLYMKGTKRHFCEPDYIEAYPNAPDDIIVMFLPMKAAWNIDAHALLQLCKEFNVDMKIQGFERGMQFSKIIEIVNGEILQDDEIKYDDWEWDCICPDLGG